jgi:hypothetical protein
MLKIITKNSIVRQLLDQGYTKVETPFNRCKNIIRYEKGISDTVKDIIEKVDGCKVEGANVISKFTKSPIGVDDISDGAKTCIYVYFRTKLLPNNKEIINITECGPNAIEYILKNFSESDLNLVIYHYYLPSHVRVKFKFNNEVFNDTDEVY